MEIVEFSVHLRHVACAIVQKSALIRKRVCLIKIMVINCTTENRLEQWKKNYRIISNLGTPKIIISLAGD